jgi:tetratricopeptide (TPR) repeat protein
MTTAIIIVILIVFLSVGLFFLIKKLSYVSDIEPEIYEAEGVITDFNIIPQEDEQSGDNNRDIYKSKIQFAVLIGKIYQFFNQQLQKINQISIQYKQKQIEKIKAKEKAIQEAIQKDLEEQELEDKQRKENIIEEVDTSYFESENSVVTNIIDNQVDSKPKKVEEVITPETKATDFVEQLLSESDTVPSVSSDDISDTYYYEYMEKRYIDKIVTNSKDIEAYKKLGELYVDMRNYNDALEAFKYVLKLKPNDTLASRRVQDISNRLQKKK